MISETVPWDAGDAVEHPYERVAGVAETLNDVRGITGIATLNGRTRPEVLVQSLMALSFPCPINLLSPHLHVHQQIIWHGLWDG